ncbi:probable mitochondrial-processing peptidase subunit alpha-2, chloroplastic/mitochondrial [Zerene cesonia]|uniref:probable mitochondrial-processing peptidase subunit alpha-2, chloroplastic/mitochondrial n=1 Tax=Zerene cesonia TaxID=33412 RepID=UPI0018E58C81|nr:probable mitochondrial-processing peptidase subunit alpha-2, chloroplastic/mitochondrial [Zerene cesonia]
MIWTLCWPSNQYGPLRVQRSEMMNGIKIAAAKAMGNQMAACTIMFQAGSRFETKDDFGVTHFLRTTSPASGCGYTAFSKMRVLQQAGAHLTCTSNRQYVAFTLACPLPMFADVKYYLLDTAARMCYNHWEIGDCMPQVRDDLFRLTPEQLCIDLVQRACWAGPLANSIYCEESRVASMSQERMCAFVYDNFKSSQCTVASVGVPFEETLDIADNIEIARVRPPDRPQMVSRPKAGFEYYDLGACKDTCIAAVVPSCGTYDVTDLFKHAIIASACGTGDMSSGQHDLDHTPQGPLGLMAGEDIYTKFRAFNISYMETGVFGILCNTRAQSACQSACALIEFLTSVGALDFKQIEIGKKRLKVNLALHEEDAAAASESLALQLANNIQLDSLVDCFAMIDAISVDEISCTAKCLSTKINEMAIAVVGDVGAVPHDREMLKFN